MNFDYFDVTCPKKSSNKSKKVMVKTELFQLN
jgi:hypothetical protein